jgi:hypothetical protein
LLAVAAAVTAKLAAVKVVWAAAALVVFLHLLRSL